MQSVCAYCLKGNLPGVCLHRRHFPCTVGGYHGHHSADLFQWLRLLHHQRFCQVWEHTLPAAPQQWLLFINTGCVLAFWKLFLRLMKRWWPRCCFVTADQCPTQSAGQAVMGPPGRHTGSEGCHATQGFGCSANGNRRGKLKMFIPLKKKKKVHKSVF